MRGEFITIYGINNLGKSTQANILSENLQSLSIKSKVIKYGDYEIKPSGPLLNAYLRGGNTFKLSAREFQLVHIINRMQKEPYVTKHLEAGIWIIAEDYAGTGLAWGLGAGINENFLEEINSHLLREDLAILLAGERFLQGKEEVHKHEQDDAFTEKVRQAHLYLAQKKNWKIINANQSREKVSSDIWEHIEPLAKEFIAP